MKLLRSIIIVLTIAVFFSGTSHAQWAPTNLMSGNINIVYYNGTDLLGGMNGNGGSVLISHDDGTNWGSADVGMVNHSDIRAFASNTSYIYCGTTNGVYRSPNNGTYNWTKVLDSASCFALLLDGTNIFAGTMGRGVLFSSNNGQSWTSRNVGMEVYPFVYALTAKDGYLFAGKYGQGGPPADGIYRSADYGLTWTQINNGLTNTDVFALAVKDQYIFAGTNGQIFRSSNYGNSWNLIGYGITHTFKIVCSDIYAGQLSGGGVIKSTDDGTTWTGFSGGLPNTGGYTVMSLTKSDTYLFAGTLGGGVARSLYECPATIRGMKFYDINGNGVKDTNETGLQNWTINLSYTDTSGTHTLQQITDADGKYAFLNLKPGLQYNVFETNQAGWQQTHPAFPVSYTVEPTAGQNIDSLDFGNKLLPSTGCVEPPQGMVAWYGMDEVVGATTIKDFMGFNPGVPQPGPVGIISGHGPTDSGTLLFLNPHAKVGGSLYFVPNATQNYIRVPNSTSLNFGVSDFSIDAWIYYPTIGAQYVLPIVEKSQAYNANYCTGFRVFILNNLLNFVVMDGTQMSVTTAPVVNSHWQHIAVVRKGGTPNTMQIYINGSLITTSTAQINNISNTTDLLIGGYASPTSPCGLPASFNAGEIAIDEVEIFNRALYQNEIVSIWHADSLGKCKQGSLCGVKFNDLNGNGVRDANEPGLANWQITLNNPMIPAVTTDATGNYAFTTFLREHTLSRK